MTHFEGRDLDQCFGSYEQFIANTDRHSEDELHELEEYYDRETNTFMPVEGDGFEFQEMGDETGASETEDVSMDTDAEAENLQEE